MKFNIGFDMGLVLAKGIVLSLLTVVFFMPAMILRMTPMIEKTSHRSFLPSFDKAQPRYLQQPPHRADSDCGAGDPAYTAQSMNDFLYGNDAVGASEGTTVYEDDELITAKFGRSNMMMAIVPDTSFIKEKQFTDELEDLPYMKSVTSLSGQLRRAYRKISFRTASQASYIKRLCENPYLR